MSALCTAPSRPVRNPTTRGETCRCVDESLRTNASPARRVDKPVDNADALPTALPTLSGLSPTSSTGPTTGDSHRTTPHIPSPRLPPPTVQDNICAPLKPIPTSPTGWLTPNPSGSFPYGIRLGCIVKSLYVRGNTEGTTIEPFWKTLGKAGIYGWILAEREGFEPPVPRKGQLISSQPRSATPAPLRARDEHPARGRYCRESAAVRECSEHRPVVHAIRARRSVPGRRRFPDRSPVPDRRSRRTELAGVRPSDTRQRLAPRPPLRSAAARSGECASITTLVPGSTRSNRSMTSSLRMRMQPWEPGLVMSTSSGQPWM